MATKLEVLQEHCHRFENGLAVAASADEARLLRERVCQELGESCQSWIVRELLEEHADSLIRARFAAVPDGRPAS
jgi:hypothetical protein